MCIRDRLHLTTWVVLIVSKGGIVPDMILPPLLFLMGFGSSAVILTWSCSKDVNDPAISGIATSIVNMGGFIGAAIIPVLIGIVIDRYGAQLAPALLYQRAFLICLAAVTLSLGSTLMVKETYCQNIFRHK